MFYALKTPEIVKEVAGPICLVKSDNMTVGRYVNYGGGKFAEFTNIGKDLKEFQIRTGTELL